MQLAITSPRIRRMEHTFACRFAVRSPRPPPADGAVAPVPVPAGGAPPAPQETLPIYGPLSLRLANGELWSKT